MAPTLNFFYIKIRMFITNANLVVGFRYYAIHDPHTSILFYHLKFEIVSWVRNLTYEPSISINKPSYL